jgi:peptidoglycan hydrolase-like protein with peptidoglycan-binding domain
VTTAQADLTKAQDNLKAAGQKFCSDAANYISALDRYGRVFTDSKATVGDVKTAGTDLAAPQEAVTSAAASVTSARNDVTAAQKDLADAQAALAAANSTGSSSTGATTSTTTTTLVSPASIDRVKQAQSDLATVSQTITDSTPVVQATVAYHSATFALEIAWLRLFAEAGCLTDAQQAQAVQQVTNYTAALQSQLQKAGYYNGPIDGVYGLQTVNAVKQLQTDSRLPATGLVDKPTALALDQRAAASQPAPATPSTQTAALQTILKLTGFWTGPIDGIWSDELTTALKNFQMALGVEPTGAVDGSTLAAFQIALANARGSTTTTTTAVLPTTTSSSVVPPTSTISSTTSPNTTSVGTTTTYVFGVCD